MICVEFVGEIILLAKIVAENPMDIEVCVELIAVAKYVYSLVYDACGVCNGDNSSCMDCWGIINGTARYDACGVCQGDNSTCTDCQGVLFGNAYNDSCGIVMVLIATLILSEIMFQEMDSRVSK